ncbi:hypothetical protein V8C35DRAFT_286235 [Trichoderma chlorosporum]
MRRTSRNRNRVHDLSCFEAKTKHLRPIGVGVTMADQPQQQRIHPARRIPSSPACLLLLDCMSPEANMGIPRGQRELVAHCVRETRIAKCARRANEAASSARNRGALPL